MVLPEVGHLTNEIEKAHWVRKLANTIDVTEESVWHELAKPSINRQNPFQQEVTEAGVLIKSRREHLEELTLGLFGLLGQTHKNMAGLASDFFLKEIHRDIFNKISSGKEPPELSEGLKDYLNQLTFRAEVFLGASPDKESEARSIVHELRIEHLKHRRDSITRKIIEAEKIGNEPELVSLSKDYKNICEAILAVSSETY